MKIRRTAALGLLAMGAMFAQGCWLFIGAAGVGAGAVWYYGALRSVEDTDHRTLHEACRKALSQMDIPITSDRIDATVGEIRAKTADDKDVRISVKHVTPETAELVIRIGLADETRARKLYERIKQNLPASQ
jgi:hypothetical protein